MIRLTNAGTGAGAGGEPLDIDEAQIVSVTVDPVRPGSQLTVVTTQFGIWYLVRESVEQVEQMIASAKGN
jgi:hypothetical protein